MSEQGELTPASDRDAADDERLRRLLSQRRVGELPSEIEVRVLSRISRRRFLSRAAGAGLGTAAAAGLAVATLHILSPHPQPVADLPIQPAAEVPVSDLEEGQVAALSAPPPVAQFRLLAQDQSAILESLVSLEEDGI